MLAMIVIHHLLMILYFFFLYFLELRLELHFPAMQIGIDAFFAYIEIALFAVMKLFTKLPAELALATCLEQS
jgi:hypothetical protein